MSPNQAGDVPAEAVALKSHRGVPDRAMSGDAGEAKATFVTVGANRASEEWLMAMKGDEARIRAAGCDGYMAKPLACEDFPAVISAHLMVLPL
jgi:hypothetical protein